MTDFWKYMLGVNEMLKIKINVKVFNMVTVTKLKHW